MLRHNIQSQLEGRRNDLGHMEAMTVKHGQVIGWVEVEQTGEADAEIMFPVLFMERPIFTFGMELTDNQWPTVGDYPTCSAVVVEWIMQSDWLFAGAKLAIVVGGPSDLKTNLHYTFTGKVFQNPVNDAGSTNDVI